MYEVWLELTVQVTAAPGRPPPAKYLAEAVTSAPAPTRCGPSLARTPTSNSGRRNSWIWKPWRCWPSSAPTAVWRRSAIELPASCSAEVTIDEDQLTVDLSFSGLGANSVGSHIHCCTAAGSNVGVAILFPSFPVGVTSGTYAQNFDLASAATYLAAFVNANGGSAAGAKAALLAGIARGHAYTCVHTITFGGGEIRSQLAFDSFADGFESFDILDWSASVP